MGKLLRFEICLNNPTGIYHPGDTLQGHVILKVKEDIPLYGKPPIHFISRTQDSGMIHSGEESCGSLQDSGNLENYVGDNKCLLHPHNPIYQSIRVIARLFKANIWNSSAWVALEGICGHWGKEKSSSITQGTGGCSRCFACCIISYIYGAWLGVFPWGLQMSLMVNAPCWSVFNLVNDTMDESLGTSTRVDESDQIKSGVISLLTSSPQRSVWCKWHAWLIIRCMGWTMRSFAWFIVPVNDCIWW